MGIEFKTSDQVDLYTEKYRDVYTGVPTRGVQDLFDRLQHATMTSNPDMPSWEEKDFKNFFGFPEDADLYKIAKDASVLSFITYYCGGNYHHAINDYLRFGFTSLKGCFCLVNTMEDTGGPMANLRQLSPDEVADMMNDVFCRYPTEDDLVLWRLVQTGVRLGFQNPFGKFFKRSYEEKGFLSCGSVLESLENSGEYDKCNLILKLHVPKGTPSLYVDYISNRTHEKEWILPPGCVLQQRSRPKKHNGKLMVECDVLVNEKLLNKSRGYEQAGLTHQPTYYANLLKREREQAEELASAVCKSTPLKEKIASASAIRSVSRPEIKKNIELEL